MPLKPYKKTYHSEMRLFDPTGERLYLTKKERKKFIKESVMLDAVNRMYCHLLAFTGCRSSEGIQLTMDRVDFDNCQIIIKTLKQHKLDRQGKVKQPKYRQVPVPSDFIEDLDLVFGIRKLQKKNKTKGVLLWTKCRTTMYRKVKDVMLKAGIKGAMATCKGLRHGFAVSMLTSDKPLPLHVLSKLLGHSDSKITEIYLQVVKEEYHKLVNDAWE